MLDFQRSQSDLREDLVAAAIDLQSECDELRNESSLLRVEIDRLGSALVVSERWRHRFQLALRFYLEQSKTNDDKLSREAVTVIQRILEGEAGEDLVAE